MHVVNEITEELLDLEPKPKSWWWHRAEHGEQEPDMGFALHGSVRCIGTPLPSGRRRRSRDRENAAQRCGQLVARWLHLSFKECSHKDDVSKGVSYVCSTSVNWLTKMHLWKSKILRLTLRPKKNGGESWVECRKRTSQTLRQVQEKECGRLMTRRTCKIL